MRRFDAARRLEAAHSLLLLQGQSDHVLSQSSSGCDLSTNKSIQTDPTASTKEASTQTDLSVELISKLEEEITYLRSEKQQLAQALEDKYLTEESLQSSDSKVKFFTGLPKYSVLKCVLDFVAGHVEENQRSLPVFQQCLLVLMKLRLNLFNQDLAYRFGVSQSTISKIFSKWINIMCERLKSLIKWPSCNELIKTMPEEFNRTFSKCVCVIDCFEVFCERPRDLMARAQTYSNYFVCFQRLGRACF